MSLSGGRRFHVAPSEKIRHRLGYTTPGMRRFVRAPLYLSEMGRRFGGGRSDCPVTDDVSDRLLRLLFYRTPSDTDLERVVAVVRR